MTSDSALIRAMARYIISTGSEATRCKNDIRKLLEAPAPERKFSGDFKADAERLLLEIGAPAQLIGFGYCVKAVSMIAKDPTNRRKINDICREIGKSCNTNEDAVYRSIQNLVNAVFERSTIEVLARYFGNAIDCERGKCTTTEFVHRLAIYINSHM